MRVLLVHPEDSPVVGEWIGSRWDLVVDLGWAGATQYAEWGEKLACQTRGLYSYGEWYDDVARIRGVLHAGGDCLVDAEGIDWWELLAPDVFRETFEFLQLLKIAEAIQSPGEIRVTRPHRHADTLGKLLRISVPPFISQRPPVLARTRRYTEALRSLTSGQIAGIVFDKWDLDYRLRRFLYGWKHNSNVEQRVLLPSAYRNVSRVLTAYANVLPDRRFLLVTTRADGEIHDLPSNVDSVPLAAYAPWQRNKSSEGEIAALTGRWPELQRRLQQLTDPAPGHAAGLFPDFARFLRVSMRIRDIWREVFDRDQISSVLCGDENNAFTRLPVLLAKNRRLRTVHCSHGALDVNLMIRGVCSDLYLAKGEMEKDYMAQHCGVPEERIVPGASPATHCFFSGYARSPGDQIVFFSEPYELYAGRTETLYRELLPSLCAIARQRMRRVVLKLHPFESAKARSRLLDRILSDEDRSLVEVSTAPISEQLLSRTWFGLAVESSVALECALARIPFFLCGWFDLGLHRYGRQYEQFGVARILTNPSEVLFIPQMLDSQPPAAHSRNLSYPPITQAELCNIL